MIRQAIFPLLVVGAMSAQESQSLKIGIVFPEGLTEKASVTYQRRDAVPGNGHRYYGVTFHADQSFVEVPVTTERFTALVWAPGCKMKHFDVPVEKSNITLQFVCDSLSTVPFHGRVQGVEIGNSAEISVSYMSMENLHVARRSRGEEDQFLL